MKNPDAETQTQALIDLFEARRKQLGMSHQALADQTGLARSTISYTLNGKSVPTITVCFKIAAALGIDISAKHT